MPVPVGAVVEIVERGSGTGPVIPRAVKVNGVDVGLVAAESVKVDLGDTEGTPATVTLTLLPRRIVIGYEDGDGKAEQA
jgi:hypothetical protein